MGSTPSTSRRSASSPASRSGSATRRSSVWASRTSRKRRRRSTSSASEVNRWLALGVLAALAAYVGWVWKGGRRIGKRRVRGHAAERSADPPPDRHRHRRPLVLRARHARPAAGRARDRLHHAGGRLRIGHAAGLREPLAGRHRRVRRGDAGRAVSLRPRGAPREPPALPSALLHHAVRARAAGARRARARASASAAPSRGSRPGRSARPLPFAPRSTAIRASRPLQSGAWRRMR